MGAWHLGGSLIELIGREWAITTGGVYAPDHDYFLPQKEFPDRFEEAVLRRQGRDAIDVETWCPDSPEWAEPEEWRRVINHAKRIFPRRFTIAGSIFVAQRQRPWTGIEEPQSH